ncbi:MAG TPA: pantetheine-phosphate adenylyltransferase [Candidatus Dormibacteraeota bacterium]|jgi:pantetheine-phosphate adenylyltransferase|nr:pantetheine-phosphate adenylyltransferase [Candidatus Dormibacteraeota bacterium]
MTRIAVYPGSFDPVTLGHIDVLERATLIFDRVIMSVLENPAKSGLFTVEERVELIRQSVNENPRVEVDTFQGLTVEYARRVGAAAIVRGLRAVSDFENEFQMALMNRRLAPEIHTVFLMTSFSNVYVSSSLIKEVYRFGGSVEDVLPAPSARAMRRRFGRNDPDPQQGVAP